MLPFSAVGVGGFPFKCTEQQRSSSLLLYLCTNIHCIDLFSRDREWQRSRRKGGCQNSINSPCTSLLKVGCDDALAI